MSATPESTAPAGPVVDTVEWRASYPGGWSRNFRFGEWLGDPITPLFETLLLPALETSFWAALRRLTGMPTPQPTYVVVHGWYFTSLNFWPAHPLGWLWRIARHPRLMRVMLQFTPAFVDWALAPWIRQWRADGLPRYRATVEHAAAEVDRLSPPEVLPLIQRIGHAAGEYFAWIALVAGAGYKTEAPLARFYRRHLYPTLGGSHQDVLTDARTSPSLGTPTPSADAHALHSLDWFHPTLGELGGTDMPTSGAESRSRAHDHAEAAARAALARNPRRLREFERLLATARRYAALREEIVSSFTLGWPVLRRAALRLGDALVRTHTLDAPDQVFFLTHAEVTTALHTPSPHSLTAIATQRRRQWEHRRALTPPLRLGQAPATFSRGLDQLQADLSPAPPATASQPFLKGQPVSPGRATGPARIIRGPSDFHRLQPGDVLVAPTTAPAWTPLFGRAAAVVTDTGSVLAHTSLVAREFGIPAVVATTHATSTLPDGHPITVDGTTGTVELEGTPASWLV